MRVSEYWISEKHQNIDLVQDLSFKVSHVKNMMTYMIRQQFFDNQIYNEFLKEVCLDNKDEYVQNRKYLNIGFIEKEIAKKPRQFKDKGVEYINYYHDLPKNIVQQIRRQLIKTWKGHFKSIKKNVNDKNGKKIGLPGYCKNETSTVIISKNDFSLTYYKTTNDFYKNKPISLKKIRKLPQKLHKKIRTSVVISKRKYPGNSLLLEPGLYFIQEIKIIPKQNDNYCMHLVYDPNIQFIGKTSPKIKVIQSRRKHIRIKNTKKNKDIVAAIDLGINNTISMSIINKNTAKIIKTYQVKKSEHEPINKIATKINEIKSQKSLLIDSNYLKMRKANNKNKTIESKKNFEPIRGDLKNNPKPPGWFSSTLDYMENNSKDDFQTFMKLSKLEADLRMKREKNVKSHIHSLSSKVTQLCILHGVSKLIVGKNQDMKQNMTGHDWNQFPHSKMIDMLEYKCEDVCIGFVKQDEAYTSKSSYFDLEPFEHGFKYSGKRDGLWFYRNKTTKSGLIVRKKYDADLHGSLNICRKYLEKLGPAIKPVGESELPLPRKVKIHCSVFFKRTSPL